MARVRTLVAAVVVLCAGLTVAPAPRSQRCLSVTLTPGHIARVVDGDTYDGYNADDMSGYVRFRQRGVDTYEIASRRPTCRPAIACAGRDSAAAWLYRDTFRIQTCERDSFGRPLVWTSRGADSLHTHLIRLRLGVPR